MPEGRYQRGEARGKARGEMPEKLGIGLLANRRLGDAAEIFLVAILDLITSVRLLIWAKKLSRINTATRQSPQNQDKK